ncbi:hypothetical protein OIU79_027699 [Salix purpurea]|uniref:Uncharacterized protein n=1 Tax=Salix purpurea TaxID=77065 RepID=A0A9Q0VUV5_SALPP|nr:hypothetical protein OIU79_027699 [Salix purpurea]
MLSPEMAYWSFCHFFDLPQ